MVLISLNVCLMVVSSNLKCVSRSFIEGLCVVPLALAVMTMSGSTFHPKFVMLSRRGWYFWVLFVIASCGNMSLQYVNSINWNVRLSDELDGGSLLCGCPLTHRIYGLNMALKWHLCSSHVHANSHGGTVFSWGHIYTLTLIMSHHSFHQKMWYNMTYLIMPRLEDLRILWHYQRNR